MLAGVIAQEASFRIVYYMAIGVQFVILALLHVTLPDWPAKNKGTTYFQILWTMGKYAVTEPVLIQVRFEVVPLSPPCGAVFFW